MSEQPARPHTPHGVGQKPNYEPTQIDVVAARDFTPQAARGTREAVDALCGEMLDGKYMIEAFLGQSPTGLVYRAANVSIGTQVAVKVLPPEWQTDTVLVERFVTEARIGSRLEHPNCVAVLDHGKDEHGRMYTVREFVDGMPLAALLESIGALPTERVVRIATQALSAIDEAHVHELVHGDLSPWTIILERRAGDTELVRVIDFGRVEDARLQTTSFEGDPRYAAPEVLAGEPFDARADLYSVGAIVYQMMTGQAPFRGTPAELVEQHQSASPAPPGVVRPDLQVDPALSEIVLRCLAKSPDRRPSNADALGQLLMEVVQPSGGIDMLTGKISSVPPAVSWLEEAPGVVRERERKTVARGVIIGAVAAVLLAIALGFFLFADGDDETAATAAPAEGNTAAEDTGSTTVAPEMVEAEAVGGTETAEGETEAMGDGFAVEDDGETEVAPSAEGSAGDPEEADAAAERPDKPRRKRDAGKGEAAAVDEEDGEVTLDYTEEDVDRELDEERDSKRSRRDSRKAQKRTDAVTSTMLKNAKSLLESGNTSGARRLVEQALKRDPGNRKAKRLMKKIKAAE